MIHNITERSYEVTVEHHPNEYETKQIAPRDGWTFVGVLQGKTLITAKPSTGGEAIEITCAVAGNIQIMTDITMDGFVTRDSSKHSIKNNNRIHVNKKKDTDVIHLPKRKLMQYNK